MEKDLKKISAILKRELPKLKSEFNVATLEIFGSFVRNEQKPDSDLDILVTFSIVPNLFQFVELENYLSDLFGLKVDLVMRSTLKPNIGKRIISEAKQII
jgi:predicted nucleotidyltransferase